MASGELVFSTSAGPRGNTQKRMERETNTKIAIRGKGSVKEGSKARQVMKGLDDENDDLHVLIQGDTEEEVCSASARVCRESWF
jgi:splicing factor 1